MKLMEQNIQKFNNIYVLLARLFFGGAMIYHGYPKLMNLSSFTAKVSQMGIPLAPVSAPMAMAAELIGGLLILVGYKTRSAALFLLITMLVASFVAHGADPFSKQEKALAFAALSLMLMAFGPGKFSIDKR